MTAKRIGDSVVLYLSDDEHRWLVQAANLETQLEQRYEHGPIAAYREWVVRQAHECWGCRVLHVSRGFVRWLAYVNRWAKKLERARRAPIRWETA